MTIPPTSTPTGMTMTGPTSSRPAGLTWFRLEGGHAVVDFPLRLTRESRPWAATIWPDPRAATGWGGQHWRPSESGRGFVPSIVELGDVIEFGVQHAPTPDPLHGGASGEPPQYGGRGRGLAAAGPPERAFWHGYLHAVRPDGIVIHGPHRGAHHAHAAAQQALLAHLRTHADPGMGDSLAGALGGMRLDRPRAGQPGWELRHDPGLGEHEPAVLAQPPVTVSVSFHDRHATVGDPVHGWLVVDAAHLLSAMTAAPDQLAHRLATHVRLTGHEPALTLAALAVRHLPELPHPTPTAASNPAPPTSPTTEASL
jgi:hypothetical protein